MNEYTYRDATKGDIEQLHSLMLDLGYKVNKTDLLDRIELIRNKGDKLIVADKGGVIVGVVQALIDIRLAEGKNGEIVSLVVSSASQGNGVGKKLLTLAKEFLLDSQCNSIRVRANSVRKNAHEFYKALGFIEKKTQKIFEDRNV